MSALSLSTKGLADIVDARVNGDRILRFLSDGKVKTGLDRCVPSAVDLAAVAIARSVVTDPQLPALALTLPRGHNRVPFIVGLHLALGRLPVDGRQSYLPFTGSVALATLDLGLRNFARSLKTEGTAIADVIEVHRLGNAGTYVDLRSGRAGELDRRQHFLLVHLPHLRPHLEPGLVSVSVLDAYAMRPTSWEAAFAWNAADRRDQVWVGELGNAAFERFCQDHGIPLVNFDWPTVEELVRDERSRCGEGPLASHGLCARVGDPPRFVLHPVADGEANELIADLERRFASYYRKAAKLREKGLEEPQVVQTARRLFYFLARSVAPLSVYEPLALDIPRSFRPAKALKRVRDARDVEFPGPWKRLLTEWSAVRASLTALYERVKDEHPKFWDLYVLLEREQQCQPRRRVVLRCATKAEARALELALLDQKAVEPSDFDGDGFLEVRWFGVRSGPLECGNSWENTLTVLFEPPGPNYAGVYLSAEQGEVEALLYPVECQRFERMAERTTAHWAATDHNLATLGELGWPVAGMTPTAAPSPLDIKKDEPFDIPGRTETKTVELGESVDRMQDHWGEYLAIEDGDEPGSGENTALPVQATDGRGPYAGRLVAARLVRFTDGRYVYFPLDGTVDVIFADRPVPQPITGIHSGQPIAFMEGSERGSALTELFEIFDDQYGPAKVYGELWRRVLRLASEKAGSDSVLARMMRPPVTEQTARNWRTSEVLAPMDDDHFDQLIDLSGEEVAQHNRHRIRRYIERVRGAHRALGRILNRAIGEQLWEPGGPEQRQLEEMLGDVDLTELFSSVEVCSIAWAAEESRDVPTGLLGRTLPEAHPEVRGHEK